MKVTVLFLGIIFSVGTKAFSQNGFPPAFGVNTDTATFIKLPGSNWQYLVEKEKYLSFNDVLEPEWSARFITPGTSAANVGLNNKIWIRYKIKNSLNRPLGITINDAAGNTSVYISVDNEKWQHYTTGYEVPWSKRDGLKLLRYIPFTIPANGEITVYIKHENGYGNIPAATSVSIGIEANVIARYYVNNDNSRVDNTIQSFLSGLMFFAFVFNLFFFFIIREKVYLYYSIFLLLCAVLPPPVFFLFTREISTHSLIN